MTMETNGPTHASVYCAIPPVRFGISAFSSQMENAGRMLNAQAIAMVMINGSPMADAPCPMESRQLVAIINPTPVATILGKPSFFSCIISQLFSGTNPYFSPYSSASMPSSPVRTRMTLVTSETKILPSPICPVYSSFLTNSSSPSSSSVGRTIMTTSLGSRLISLFFSSTSNS